MVTPPEPFFGDPNIQWVIERLAKETIHIISKGEFTYRAARWGDGQTEGGTGLAAFLTTFYGGVTFVSVAAPERILPTP